MEIIKTENLIKVFRVPKNRKGFINSFKDMLKREWEEVHALKGIDLSINKGEIVGYIGPNGAGKSTTLKIISGVLYPTSGNVVVDGIVPYKNKMENAGKITFLAGQRSILYWDLPVNDTFELMKRVYRIPRDVYKKNLDMFCEILGIGDLLNVPTRMLSLGQRMRADFAAAMLHNPKIVYLDEPTIGLDVVAKDHIRDFIKEINKTRNTTVIITSHDIADIERICNRVIVIDRGELIYSGSINKLKAMYSNKNCILIVKLEDHVDNLQIKGFRVSKNGNVFHVYFDRSKNTASSILYRLLEKKLKVVDFTLNESSLEDTVKYIYNNQGK